MIEFEFSTGYTKEELIEFLLKERVILFDVETKEYPEDVKFLKPVPFTQDEGKPILKPELLEKIAEKQDD